MKKEKLKRIARRITAFAAAVAMAATFTFPAEVGDGFFDGFGNAIVASAETGDFTVTGGTEGTDYSYADNVLTILTETPLTISGTTTTDRIEVASGVSANITLDGVDIDVSSKSNTAAFKIADNSTGNVTITLADGSENTLKSGRNCAGLQKNGSGEGIGKLTIKSESGTGKLTATGDEYGAGIGGGEYGTGSNITISGGTVTAIGGLEGAGIGGGYSGSGSNITISGGIVTVNGMAGAGIGGGYSGTGSNITISGGTVTATGGSGGAGIGGGDNQSGSYITISDGTVTAKSANKGAGIGGGYSGSGSNITISGGTGTATGGSCGAGIGGGTYKPGSDITISGGTVTATGGTWGAGIGGGYYSNGSGITISGGSVNAVLGSEANAIGGGKVGNGAVTPTLADGTTKVFLYQIDGANSIKIDGVTYPTTHNGVNSLYPYLSAGYHTVKIGEVEKTIHIAENGTITDPATPATQGAFEIYGGELNTDYSYSGGVLTIKTATPLMIKNTTPTTATTDRIEVESDVSANITLAGVNISSSYNAAAFKIADNSTGNVTVNLVGENMLKSGSRCAGLQKNGNAEGIGKLTIKGGTNGTGKLTATGGMTGAGIGGGNYGSCSNIEISGGTVTATGGDTGAGIGGGNSGSGSYITISGGTVTATGGGSGAGIGGGTQGDGSAIIISGGTVAATGGPMGAGIGGGFCSSGSYITISGGTVTAIVGEYGAGIGGGNRGSGSYITISGGTVTATGGRNGAGIGGGDYGQASDIRISGGSVNAVAGENANAIGGGFNQSAVIPTLADGAANVYLLTIENPDGKDVFIDGSTTPYKPSNHSAAGTGDTNLYAYLTGETHKVKIGDEETEYKFYTNKFLPVPKASDFTFTAPTAPIVYDNTAKEATVTGISGTGTVTVKYYLVEGDTETLLTDDNKPVNAGTYKVKIDVEKGTSYADVQELTADEWKFTITSGTLTAADFDFTKPSNLVYDGNAKTATVTANSGITGIGTITVKYQKTGDTTATTEAPKTPGIYKVSIDVTAGTNYAAVTDLTADTWTFTVTSGTLTAADFTFAAPSNLVYDGNAKKATVTAKTGI
ncbi:MAG: hypothetical protein MSJ26_06545, partial [Oscillospiraceae bacterium]|nr:hypothetical protein [Oscillospiraceae bacterium]